MRYVCSGCKGEFNLPESMLPPSGKFRLKCPSCGQASILDRDELEAQSSEPAAPPAPEPAPASEPSPAPAPPRAASSASPAASSGSAGPEKASGAEPEIYPPGSKVVLLLLADSPWKEPARAFFKEAGYIESLCHDAREALEKLRLNAYQVLVMDDAPVNGDVAAFVDSWSGLKRRSLNLAVIGQAGVSLDPGIGYVRGVNAYLNSNDHGRARELLEAVLDGFDEYYAPIREAQGKAGGGNG